MEVTKAQNKHLQQYQKNDGAAIRSLENQIGQLAKQIANNNNQEGTFPTNTQINQHDQVIIISDEKDEEIIHNFEENEGGEDEKVVKPDLTKLSYPLSFAHEEHNEGDEESMVEKEEEGNQEKVTENKAEIDQIIEEICALFEKKELRRIWTPQYLYLKFMEFLPNQRKKTDDVLSVSFWPP
jgi:molybdopterin converting factor small subunit